MIRLDTKMAEPCGIRAADPLTGKPFGPEFPVASEADIERAFAEAKAIGPDFGRNSELRAALLEAIAQELESAKDALIECANLETALPVGRLSGELVRTQSQLKMFAQEVRDGSWVDACIDHGDPARQPAKPDLRRMLVPIGPVAVFGASNFPFAFSVAGGDTASVLAAGCPAIVKAHPAHPGTSEMAGAAIKAAAERVGAPMGVFSLVHGGVEVGQRLVMHDAAEAVAFTGSSSAGRALFDLAAKRQVPIPVFAEMGSVNPVFVLPQALEAGFDALVAGYAASVALGVGQFCTNPGLIFGTGARFEEFIKAVAEKLASTEPGTMLTTRIRDSFQAGCRERSQTKSLKGLGATENGDGKVASRLFVTNLDAFLADRLLLEELFGPSAVAVTCADSARFLDAAEHLPGQLTASLHGTPQELESHSGLVEILTRKAGRIVFNGFPTGVEVGRAMHHGGPYPATTDSRFTSVGTSAIRRFARPVCYQDSPGELLPLELREGNPRGIWRLLDGIPGRA